MKYRTGPSSLSMCEVLCLSPGCCCVAPGGAAAPWASPVPKVPTELVDVGCRQSQELVLHRVSRLGSKPRSSQGVNCEHWESSGRIWLGCALNLAGAGNGRVAHSALTGLVSRFVLASCCGFLEGSRFLCSSAPSSSVDLIRIWCPSRARCAADASLGFNRKPAGRAAWGLRLRPLVQVTAGVWRAPLITAAVQSSSPAGLISIVSGLHAVSPGTSRGAALWLMSSFSGLSVRGSALSVRNFLSPTTTASA